ncbi:MAG TPA: hypothetical protein VG603_13085, partial [Chitinophagales bacterium]|nr:hypothetical protein [Chitinophagales bacterium]
MKKIFFVMTTGLAAIAFTSCNNGQEVQKQKDDENAKIQSMVDEKLNALQADADKACDSTVTAMATVKYNDFLADQKKHPGAKPKPKP